MSDELTTQLKLAMLPVKDMVTIQVLGIIQTYRDLANADPKTFNKSMGETKAMLLSLSDAEVNSMLGEMSTEIDDLHESLTKLENFIRENLDEPQPSE